MGNSRGMTGTVVRLSQSISLKRGDEEIFLDVATISVGGQECQLIVENNKTLRIGDVVSIESRDESQFSSTVYFLRA